MTKGVRWIIIKHKNSSTGTKLGNNKARNIKKFRQLGAAKTEQKPKSAVIKSAISLFYKT